MIFERFIYRPSDSDEKKYNDEIIFDTKIIDETIYEMAKLEDKDYKINKNHLSYNTNNATFDKMIISYKCLTIINDIFYIFDIFFKIQYLRISKKCFFISKTNIIL